jgi:hypothetical protein
MQFLRNLWHRLRGSDPTVWMSEAESRDSSIRKRLGWRRVPVIRQDPDSPEARYEAQRLNSLVLSRVVQQVKEADVQAREQRARVHIESIKAMGLSPAARPQPPRVVIERRVTRTTEFTQTTEL